MQQKAADKMFQMQNNLAAVVCKMFPFEVCLKSSLSNQYIIKRTHMKDKMYYFFL